MHFEETAFEKKTVMLLEQYEDDWMKASGSTLRVVKKYALIGTRIKF